MNDLDLCLEVISRSRQPLRYIWCWISRKPLEIEAWLQWSTNTKWHMGYRMVTWPMTSSDLERSNSWPNTLRAQYLENYLSYETSNLVCSFLYGECRAGAQIIFPESGCGLGHMTPTIFGIRSNMSLLCGSTVGYPSDSLASHQFCDNYMWMIGLVGLINNLGTK